MELRQVAELWSRDGRERCDQTSAEQGHDVAVRRKTREWIVVPKHLRKPAYYKREAYRKLELFGAVAAVFFRGEWIVQNRYHVGSMADRCEALELQSTTGFGLVDSRQLPVVAG